MSTTDDTPDLEHIISGDATDEEVEAYNEAKSRELDERLLAFEEDKQEAARALIDDAEATRETATVPLESGGELEVLARVPTSVERMQARMAHIERKAKSADSDLSMDDARRFNCRMIVKMVVSPEEFTDPEVWEVASRDGAAGMQWLFEMTDRVLAPALDRLEETEGNLRRSGR